MPARAGFGENLRVGYVLKKYPRLSETFILDELLALEAAGVEVSVFSLRLPDEGRFHRDLSKLRATVSYLPSSSFSSRLLDAFGVLGGLPDAAGAIDAALGFVRLLPERARASVLVQGLLLASAAREARVDHLHAHFMTVAAHTAHVAHLVTGLPFSVTAHAKDVYRETVDRDVFDAIASSAEAIVTVCDSNRDYIRCHLSRQAADRVVRIYNGLFPEEYEPAPLAQRRSGMILGVGRLVGKKGFHVLLHACALLAKRHTNFSCTVVGDGEERDSLLAETRRLGLGGQVEFTGSLPRHRVLELMSSARVLAAPCVVADDGNRDALPTVLLEALGVGLPVVTTRVTGIPEIIEDEREGLLVDAGDAEGLADALERVLHDDGLWDACSTRGPVKLHERFDRRQTAAELIETFTMSPSAVQGVPA
ncbi:MAG TPA: glycosyltransferase [Acidimicrobiia bacterium]